jgi:hypothetical protein
MNYVDNDDVKKYDDYNNDCEMLIMERLLQILCKMLIMVRLMLVICKMLINVRLMLVICKMFWNLSTNY